jgi:hypothetical protein
MCFAKHTLIQKKKTRIIGPELHSSPIPTPSPFKKIKENSIRLG